DYEGRLADAIDDLIDRKLNAITWAGVLVPFVAALMVRGRDFNERFEYRLRAFAGIWQPDNTNHARLFELQRLLGPVLAARWIVMATTGGSALITNDVGFAFFRDPSGEHGLAVPLGHRHVLGLIPVRGRAVVEAQNGVWRPL